MGLLNSPIAIVREAIKKSILEKNKLRKEKEKKVHSWSIHKRHFSLPPQLYLYTPHFINTISQPVFQRLKGQEAATWTPSHLVVRKYKLVLITQMRMMLMCSGFDTRVFFLLIILIA